MPDGTLICYGRTILSISTSDWATWSSTAEIYYVEKEFNITFPVNFISHPVVSITNGSGSLAWISGYYTETATENNKIIKIFVTAPLKNNINRVVDWIAIGRWKA